MVESAEEDPEEEYDMVESAEEDPEEDPEEEYDMVESAEEDPKEENDKSDGEGELNLDEEQDIGYDTVCAICDNGGEILPYVFII